MFEAILIKGGLFESYSERSWEQRSLGTFHHLKTYVQCDKEDLKHT